MPTAAPSMTSKPVALLLADLGVTKTHSRPHVSNDNPFSEAQFKTLKYRPDFPDRFGSIEDSRGFGHVFFPWYNTEHHHSGLGLLTPHEVHYGLAEKRVEARARVLAAAYRRPSRALRRRTAATAGAADRGLDQQAEGGARRAQSRFRARGRHKLRAHSPAEPSGGLDPYPGIPRIAVRARFGSLGAELHIAAVAPLNTEDLH